jgi:hypothetical protein
VHYFSTDVCEASSDTSPNELHERDAPHLGDFVNTSRDFVNSSPNEEHEREMPQLRDLVHRSLDLVTKSLDLVARGATPLRTRCDSRESERSLNFEICVKDLGNEGEDRHRGGRGGTGAGTQDAATQVQVIHVVSLFSVD